MGRARNTSAAVGTAAFGDIFGQRRGTDEDTSRARAADRSSERLALLRRHLGERDFDAVAGAVNDDPALLDAPDIRANVVALLDDLHGEVDAKTAAAWLRSLAQLPHAELAGPLASHVQAVADNIPAELEGTDTAIEAFGLLAKPVCDTWTQPLLEALTARMAADDCYPGDEALAAVGLVEQRPGLEAMTSAVAAGFRNQEQAGNDRRVAQLVCRRAFDVCSADDVEQLGEVVDAFCEGVRETRFRHPLAPIQAVDGLLEDTPTVGDDGRMRQLVDTLTDVYREGGKAAEAPRLIVDAIREHPQPNGYEELLEVARRAAKLPANSGYAEQTRSARKQAQRARRP